MLCSCVFVAVYAKTQGSLLSRMEWSGLTVSRFSALVFFCTEWYSDSFASADFTCQCEGVHFAVILLCKWFTGEFDVKRKNSLARL